MVTALWDSRGRTPNSPQLRLMSYSPWFQAALYTVSFNQLVYQLACKLDDCCGKQLANGSDCHFCNWLPPTVPNAVLVHLLWPYHLVLGVWLNAKEVSMKHSTIEWQAQASLYISSNSKHTWCVHHMIWAEWTDGQTERCCRHRGICYPH